MTELPTYDEIVLLHQKYAPNAAAFDLVFTHCTIVWEIAQQLIAQSHPAVNIDLVKVGCLLHDIGVYRLYLPDGQLDFKHYIQHGVLGYELLKEEGFSETICRIASCHTGTGLTKSEIAIEHLPLPPADYMAQTTEEQLVMYADKFHTKKDMKLSFMTAETYAKHIRQFGEQKVARFRGFEQKFGLPNLAVLAEKYSSDII